MKKASLDLKAPLFAGSVDIVFTVSLLHSHLSQLWQLQVDSGSFFFLVDDLAKDANEFKSKVFSALSQNPIVNYLFIVCLCLSPLGEGDTYITHYIQSRGMLAPW